MQHAGIILNNPRVRAEPPASQKATRPHHNSIGATAFYAVDKWMFRNTNFHERRVVSYAILGVAAVTPAHKAGVGEQQREKRVAHIKEWSSNNIFGFALPPPYIFVMYVVRCE